MALWQCRHTTHCCIAILLRTPTPSNNPVPCGASQPELSLLGGAHPLPEVEVVLATLWTVASWRGVYAAYRAWANFF